MSMRLIGSSGQFVWLLFMATAALLAQSYNNTHNTPAVLDSNGYPLKPGQEYYIKSVITPDAGRSTLIDRNNGSCPLYVGLENNDIPQGIPVIFTPFSEKDGVVKVNRDFKVAFASWSSTTTKGACVNSSREWKLMGQKNETKSGRRRVIVTGKDDRLYGNYFRIVETKSERFYNIQWCPKDVCPNCRFACGTVGGWSEDGKILMALDGSVLPFMFT